jgi:radical SAM protein with 4Fe4S-binding SPASM domain
MAQPFTKEGILHATVNGHRFHLRLKDPIEDNFLWIDGRVLLVLDTVAADFVAYTIEAMWLYQQGQGDESDRVKQYVLNKMYKKYGWGFPWFDRRVATEKMRRDLDRIFGTIMGIAEGGCPVDAEMEMKEVDITKWIAPARMDLAVTYRCNLDCPHCYTWAGPNGGVKELPLADWIRVLDTLWNIGIPNLVFTGGEPTLREDIVDLVANAKHFVTGLVTNGTKLAGLAEQLRDASLDYIQVTLESHIPQIHNKMVGASFDAFSLTVDGIKHAVELGMQVITNTTLTKENASLFRDLLKFGKDIGLKDMCCNTLICSGRGVAAKKDNGISLDEIKVILEQAANTAKELGINLQWYSPTCYLHLNPVELGFGAKGCSAAAYNMTVQPDGTVLPCQSWPDTVGNILNDSWESIWNHPTCMKLRHHGFAQENAACKDCVHNQICGGACPLERKGGSQ